MFTSASKAAAARVVAIALVCGILQGLPSVVAQEPQQPGKDSGAKSDKTESFTKVELSGGQFIIRQTGKESVQVTAENVDKAQGPGAGRGPGGDGAGAPGAGKPRGPAGDKPKGEDADKPKGEEAGKVEKSVENGTLRIKGADKKIVIEVKELTNLTVTGGSDVDVVDIKGKQLNVKIQGFGAVKLAGSVDDQVIDVLGRGTFNGEACKGKQGKVSLKGSCNVVINVTDNLHIDGVGNGTVEYIGSPKVEKNVAMGVTVSQTGPPAPDDPAAVAAMQAAATKPWFDSAGVPIHYIVTGKDDGEPVLLIHGFASSIDAQWAPVIEALKKDYKVIAMDIRGCGGSGKPHDPRKYGIEMMNDVVRLLDHLKIDKAHIVGYSMSAGTGLLLAVHHPKRLLTLSCCGAGVISFGSNTPPGNLPNPDMFPRNPGQTPILTELASALDNNSIEPLTLQLTPKNQPKPTPEQIKAHDKALMAVNDNMALAAMIRSSGYKDTRITEKEIQEIGVPTLAIIGADDPLKFGVDKMKMLLPRTKVVVIEKAHHLDAYKRPEFVTALKQFLDDNRQAGKK